MMTNGSGCGCDLASERPMVRKYVVESVLYWATAYHIDGFRFDLMALEDVDTMNAIRAALDSLPGGESILLYGEPWMGGGTNLEGGARPADKRALDALHERIGFFCDDTRDSIKGNVFDAGNAGYCDHIEVTINEDNSITVQDNGRGIPVDFHEKEKKSALIPVTPYPTRSFRLSIQFTFFIKFSLLILHPKEMPGKLPHL